MEQDKGDQETFLRGGILLPAILLVGAVSLCVFISKVKELNELNCCLRSPLALIT